MILQLMNMVGGALILIGFIGLKTRRYHNDSLVFNLVNTIGSILLGTVAVFDLRIGWIVLESVYTFYSARGLWESWRVYRFSESVKQPDSSLAAPSSVSGHSDH